MKKVYVSFPISGYDIEERKQYDEIVRKVVQKYFPDYEILTPFGMCPYDETKSYGDCMKTCISNIYDCEILVICPNWLASTGCRDEYYTAANYGLTLYDFTEIQTIEQQQIGFIEVNLLKLASRALEVQKKKTK